MRIDVDHTLCENHGQCTFAAPDVFWLNGAGELEHCGDVDESRREAVEEAADVCPVQAIRFGAA
ncbi:ferredoxin [Actinomadura madurae]|uniref:ferredoxin n=1 Tax=Actinomadura madurae TaxID=1993 RepID=UPI00399AF7BA